MSLRTEKKLYIWKSGYPIKFSLIYQREQLRIVGVPLIQCYIRIVYLKTLKLNMTYLELLLSFDFKMVNDVFKLLCERVCGSSTYVLM